jgi:hypothetical protein
MQPNGINKGLDVRLSRCSGTGLIILRRLRQQGQEFETNLRLHSDSPSRKTQPVQRTLDNLNKFLRFQTHVSLYVVGYPPPQLASQ